MDFLPIPSLIFSSSLESEALRTMYGYVFWLECFSLRLDLAGSRFLFLRQQPMSSPVIYPTFCIIPRAQLTYSRWAVPSSRFEMPLLKSEKNTSFLEWTLCWKLLFGTPNSFISTFLLKNLNQKKKKGFFRIVFILSVLLLWLLLIGIWLCNSVKSNVSLSFALSYMLV